MADGRNYASWQPEAVINKRIQKQENIHSNWAYRQYMTHHGLEVMNYNTTEACYEMGLDQHTNTTKTPSSNVPVLYKSIFDTSDPCVKHIIANASVNIKTQHEKVLDFLHEYTKIQRARDKIVKI
jgi:hypothetical protein